MVQIFQFAASRFLIGIVVAHFAGNLHLSHKKTQPIVNGLKVEIFVQMIHFGICKCLTYAAAAHKQQRLPTGKPTK